MRTLYILGIVLVGGCVNHPRTEPLTIGPGETVSLTPDQQARAICADGVRLICEAEIGARISRRACECR